MRRVDIARDGLEAARQTVRRTLPEDDAAIVGVVKGIVDDVRARGDEALLELGRRFDAPDLADLTVSPEEWDRGCAAVTPDVARALEASQRSVAAFHEPQRRSSWLDVAGGVVKGQMLRPLDRVGVYVPGGRAEYPSSVIMAAVPAAVAGVPEIVLCTPARRDGSVSPAVLFAARISGVRAIYKVGGAQAIAALAYGTTTIPRVDKIVGPGNSYVCAAKRLLWGVADMDMIAGPSEVCVVADETATPEYAAADLLTQAEHDPECAAFLITHCAGLADEVERCLERQIGDLSRAPTIRAALEDRGGIIVTRSLGESIEVANECAPEHLALMVDDPLALLSEVRHAGAVILGRWTPQTAGDYVAGPSHVLPTGGTARFWSPLNLDTFTKKTSFIGYDRGALEREAGGIVALARAEGFDAHAASVLVRTAASDAQGRVEGRQ